MKIIRELSGTPKVYPTDSDTLRLFPYTIKEIEDKDVTKDMERDCSLGLISIIDIDLPKVKAKKEAVITEKEDGGK